VLLLPFFQRSFRLFPPAVFSCPVTRFRKRIAKVLSLYQITKNFCRIFIVGSTTKPAQYFGELVRFLRRTAKIRTLFLSANFFALFPLRLQRTLTMQKRLQRSFPRRERHLTPPAFFSPRTVIFKSGSKDRQFPIPAKYFLIYFLHNA
jgi:hypothetical protein